MSERLAFERLADSIGRLLESKTIKGNYVSCSEACTLLNISKTSFYKLLKSNPQIEIKTKSHKKYKFSEILKLI